MVCFFVIVCLFGPFVLAVLDDLQRPKEDSYIYVSLTSSFSLMLCELWSSVVLICILGGFICWIVFFCNNFGCCLLILVLDACSDSTQRKGSSSGQSSVLWTCNDEVFGIFPCLNSWRGCLLFLVTRHLRCTLAFSFLYELCQIHYDQTIEEGCFGEKKKTWMGEEVANFVYGMHKLIDK